MRRFILTGAPGAGKTTLLRYLGNRGYSVVEEAATDIIAHEQQKGIQEPWINPTFIAKILELQEQRQVQAASFSSGVQFFDRSPLDTYALCEYSGYSISSTLLEKITTVQEAGMYEREVFFIENLGFCEPSAARKISFEESLRFEKIHEDVYRKWGYTCLRIPRRSVSERASTILSRLL
jgi:predicted ATPase